MKAIILDLDGLMADTEPLHMRAFNLVLQAVEVAYRLERDEYGRDFVGIPVRQNSQALRTRFGLPQSVDEILAAQRANYALLISDPRSVKPMPGLIELLADLDQLGLKQAVASGSQQDEVEKILRGLGLSDRFSVVVSGTGTPPKPNPGIYLKALQLLDLSAADALALEDSQTGIQAARAASLRVIAVRSEFTRNQDLSEADIVFDDLFQVKEHLTGGG